jgi:hypothetical protein
MALQGTMDQARLDAITVAIAASVGIEAYIAWGHAGRRAGRLTAGS